MNFPESAEVQLAAGMRQPLFTLGLPMLALYLADFVALLWGPNIDYVSDPRRFEVIFYQASYL